MAKDQVIGQKPRRTTGTDRVYSTNNYRWQQLTKKFRSHCAARHFDCWLCKTAIDYTLARGPWCFETDHYHPRVTHPHLMFTWANLRPSHLRCNRARQAKVVDPQRDWVQPQW